MIRDLNISKVLFLDVQSMVQQQEFNLLDLEQKLLFESNVAHGLGAEQSINEVYKNASNWAEFSKVICISVGYLKFTDTAKQLRVMNFVGEESQILQGITDLLQEHFNDPHTLLCGCDIKKQWVGFLQRRMLVHNMVVPDKLIQITKGADFVDPIEIWGFGNPEHQVSLNLIASTLAIKLPSSQQYLFDRHQYYYQHNTCDKIVSLSQRNVFYQAQVLLRMQGKEILKSSEVVTK